ncbi:hypothetical protein CfE428DRAFT_1882 [Chthoniobacter flavus Ellin428]|uniref:Uncharacterized protein n=1 Tax=Chthoniobacter flavus Ellin428 TaxID=497964 RepID=B4CYZ4_9BACT|nr:hypothetical protein CfE428DRAFT_1882 [Chthoniobacter flavus Ellin428]
MRKVEGVVRNVCQLLNFWRPREIWISTSRSCCA